MSAGPWRIELNGEAREVPAHSSLMQLLAGLGLPLSAVAVERNGRLVQRAEFASTQLEPGDRLEIVTLVGGG